MRKKYLPYLLFTAVVMFSAAARAQSNSGKILLSSFGPVSAVEARLYVSREQMLSTPAWKGWPEDLPLSVGAARNAAANWFIQHGIEKPELGETGLQKAFGF